jgi:hypothetical protein
MLQQPGRPSHCRLTDPSCPVCELDALRALRACASARSAGLGMDHGCMRVVMSRARKHAYPSPWPGKTRAACRTQPFGGPRTRVDRLERMSFSVAISRWADVRVT